MRSGRSPVLRPRDEGPAAATVRLIIARGQVVLVTGISRGNDKGALAARRNTGRGAGRVSGSGASTRELPAGCGSARGS